MSASVKQEKQAEKQMPDSYPEKFFETMK